MKDRIKLIRKNAGLNQAEFAAALGLSRSFISQIEIDQNVFSDRSIRDICRMFHVNEEWLRSGVGDPYAPRTRNQEIAEFMNSAMEGGDEDFKTALVSGLAALDQEDWEDLARIVRKMLKEKED